MMPPPRTIIDERYDECVDLIADLNARGALSQVQLVQELARRSLVVGAASLFEDILKALILDFVAHRSRNDSALMALVRVGFVERGFHQMFQWRSNNANSFFAYLGGELGADMKSECTRNSNLESGAKKFLELGDLRNSIAHQNFHTFYFEKTLQEAYEDYLAAKVFVDYLIVKLSAPGA
jgi:hypothetical protein